MQISAFIRNLLVSLVALGGGPRASIAQVAPVASPLPASDATAPAAAGKPAAGGNETIAEKPAAADVPKAFPSARYQALLEKSPFAVASAQPEVVAPTENFSTNLVLTGISKNRGKEGKETYTVFVRSRDLSTRMVLTGEQPGEDGTTLVSVEEAPVPAKSAVMLRKGSETGRVEFDQAAIAASASAPASAPQAPKGSAPVKATTRAPIPRPGMSNQVRPPGVSGAQPGAQPVGGVANPTQPGAVPAAQEARRRTRPIQSPSNQEQP